MIMQLPARGPAQGVSALEIYTQLKLFAYILGQFWQEVSSGMLRADTRVAGGTKAALVIPRIGLGTGGLKGAIAVGVVRTALEVGYRHLDTAEQYMNEDQVGEGLLASGVPRTAVVLTSKYQSLHADQGGKLGCGFGVRGDVFRSLNASLARLRTTFLDVYLVHFPTPVVLRNGQLVEAHCGVGTMLAERRATVWREMIEARRTGLVSPALIHRRVNARCAT